MGDTDTPATRRRGALHQAQGEIPVEVMRASDFSLYVALLDQRSILPYRQEFSHLTLDTPAGELAFGRCRYLPIADVPGFTGRLVFLDDAYNFSQFFPDSLSLNLESRLHKLAMTLNQGNAVRPAFRAYLADLNYALNAHKAFYDSLDAELLREPSEVAAAAQQAILAREAPAFYALFDAGLGELAEQTKGFSRDEHAVHGSYLRRQCWHLITTSDFLRRTNTRPRGYPGDSEMMRMLYADRFESPSLFGKMLHKHAIATPAAQAVRNRRGLIADHLREARYTSRKSGSMRVMSVACGPACEITDIFASREDIARYQVTLLDQDTEALGHACTHLREVEQRVGAPPSVTFYNDSVRTMLRAESRLHALGLYDFIYSMGLFDYLTDAVARSVARTLYGRLAPGGTLLIGNYHVDNPTRLYMAYWMDWLLCHRTEEEMHSIGMDNDNVSCTVGFEPAGAQMFLRVTKAGHP